MTPATDGANAPPGNSRFEAIASSTLTGRFFGVPFFRPSVSPALLFNVWAYLLGPFAFFLFGLWRKGIVLLLGDLEERDIVKEKLRKTVRRQMKKFTAGTVKKHFFQRLDLAANANTFHDLNLLHSVFGCAGP